ncbi:beta-agarase [Rhodanobacter sp. FDAARGOS 1247]|uniref:beta-agarase n=1 Tax=Rhodanobacter sp. FDAARGOS 1247 TaxID=2778082 RepID=UPI00194F2867|nr:beta-agarase [Rhodanobacter sp. FDAARGOS 1247]QRP64385.1 beta-agarase [Rhodanobacter sp. FDAARGOS 1247]
MRWRGWLALCCLCGLQPGHAAAPALPDLAGAGARIGLDQVRRVGAVEHAADGVAQQRYAFQPAAHPSIVMTPAGDAWDWSDAGELHVRVQNAMPWAVTLDIEIDGAGSTRLQARVGVPAGPAQTLVVPLRATSPREQGMQVGPPMPFELRGRSILLATTVQGTLDRHRVRAIRLGIPGPQAVQTLLFGKLSVTAGEAMLHEAYAGIVDRYGQSTRGRWPEKIDSDAALRAAVTAAPESAKPAGVDAHGGRLDGQKLRKTGWFHAQRQTERWQLVTPEGHPFFSLGVNAVNVGDQRTRVEGREFMFTGLPPDRGAWAAFHGRGDSRRPGQAASSGIGHDHGRWFDFHAANLYRIDGAGWLSAWRTRTLDRLQAWGFNTIGNWSDPALGQAHRLPYTRSINIAGDYANVSSGYDYWGRMPDPFDPRFVAATEAAVAKASADVRDDPWLLGYFADNELAWAGIGPQGRWGLALGTLAGEAASPAKQGFIAMLRKQYATPRALAAAWGIPLDSWKALDATGYVAPAPDEAHPAIARDYSAWLSHYADAYFRIVAAAIRRHDPHHLFLGGRFAVYTPEAVAACAQYCDVVSFNAYADLPQHHIDMARMQALDKPVLISEFHFGSNDRGPFGAGVVPVGNEAQRGEAYAKYLAAAAANPQVVGVHWFEYTDQPVTGRLLDGENSHIGLVGITDIPFGGFVRAVRQANEQAQPSGGR